MSIVLKSSLENTNQTKTISKRIEIIDALRGFALFGIILTHSCNLFVDFLPKGENLNALDSLINTAVDFLFKGRAFLIFSFLFGLSFAIQIQSAKAKDRPFIGRFIWRLTILLIIGYFHRLIFQAEILQIYAMLGLALVICAYLKNKWLLFISLILYIASIVVKFYTPELTGIIHPIAVEAENSDMLNFTGLYRLESQFLSGRAFIILALFILGLYIGKKNVFSDTLENRTLFRKALVWSIIAVLVSIIIYSIIKNSELVSYSFLKVVHNLTQITQAFFYVALIVNLYQVLIIQKIIQWLVPVGRMGLTIYIMQSLFLTQFYGLGVSIITNIGLTVAIGITIIFFLGQILFAYWWMSNYQFGPVEWLWRMLTNFRWEPIKKKPLPLIS